jgi:hypothetical protein
MFAYNTGLSAVCDTKKQKDQSWSFIASSESVMGLFKQQTLKQPKLVKLDKLLYKWFTAMRSKGKPVIGHMFMGKGK